MNDDLFIERIIDDRITDLSLEALARLHRII